MGDLLTDKQEGSEWPAVYTMVLIYLLHSQMDLNSMLGSGDRIFQGQLCPVEYALSMRGEER